MLKVSYKGPMCKACSGKPKQSWLQTSSTCSPLLQANLGEPEMAVKSVDKARHLTGDQGLLADEVSEWRDLVAAREGAQQEESLSYRVNVVEPN